MTVVSIMIESCRAIECLKDYEDDLDLCEVYSFVDCKTGIIDICEKIIRNEVMLDIVNKSLLSEERGTLISMLNDAKDIIISM
jgi:hypothetical protein